MSFFQNLIAKLHPYFSCCASCSEIKTPLENRLCTSLSPSFAVDGVLSAADPRALESVRRAMPWLRKIFIANTELPHSIPGLAEHYLVIFIDNAAEFEKSAFTILDFFTPNGLPLFYTNQATQRIFPQIRADAVAFDVSGDNELNAGTDLAGWCSRQVRWVYQQGGAVPRHSRHILPAFNPKQQSAFAPVSGSFFAQPPQAGSLTSRLGHQLFSVLMDLHPASEGCAHCRFHTTSLSSRGFPAVQPEFPVDVVYTWVDGADARHEAKRAAWMPMQGGVHENGLEMARFRDNEELRYSLRALECYAPWVRSVIVVTDEQVPAWLASAHSRIRIVDHKEFISEKYLPTFNSHVIEAYLHDIPGLAEHYIYLNDDVFLGRPCKKTDFFAPNGLPLAFVDWRKRRIAGYYYTGTPHAKSYLNTLEILKNRHIPTDARFITAHGPYAQTRANAIDTFAFYAEEIAAFAGNRFRTTNEICMYSHALPLWAYHKKRLIPCDERYYYVQTLRRDRVAYYRALLNSKMGDAPPLFFCINDVGSKRYPQYWKEDLQTLLEAYFPVPSSFESDMGGAVKHKLRSQVL